MKKLLTITSILAAGTLCANAATVFFDDIASYDEDTSKSTLTYVIASDTYGGTILSTDTSNSDKITYSSSSTGTSDMYITSSNYSCSNFSFVLDLTALKAAATATDAGTIGLLTFRATNNLNNAVGLAATSTGIQATWKGALWSGSDTATWTILEALETIRTDSNNHSYILLTLSVNGSSGTTVYDSKGNVLATNGTTSKTMSYSTLCGSDKNTDDNYRIKKGRLGIIEELNIL